MVVQVVLMGYSGAATIAVVLLSGYLNYIFIPIEWRLTLVALMLNLHRGVVLIFIIIKDPMLEIKEKITYINPLLLLVNDYFIDSPCPINISYLWGFGSLLGIHLIILVISGVT